MKGLLKLMVLSVVTVVPAVWPSNAQAGLCGPLTVENRSNECVKIFFNNGYVGTVHEGATMTFQMEDHQDATTIKAICEDGDQVARVHFHGLRNQYRMVIP